MRRGNFQPMWAKALKAAGLPRGFHFHDLRHTGNAWAAESGANLRELMGLFAMKQGGQFA
jgi:integrase